MDELTFHGYVEAGRENEGLALQIGFSPDAFISKTNRDN